MTDMAQSRLTYTWPNGGPGVTTFYWTSGIPAGPIDATMVTEFHQEVINALAVLTLNFAGDVAIAFEPDVNIIDPATGNVTDVVTQDGNPGTTGGTGAGTGISRGEQVVVNLVTDNFTAGKRLRGRHFLGPISAGVLDSGGQVPNAKAFAFEDAYDAITSGVGPRLAVWHRPNLAGPGYYGDVVAVKASRRPGLLRSRRD